MSKAKAKCKYTGSQHPCAVIDCKNPSSQIHKVPVQADIRAKWIDFIFDGNVPVSVKPSLYVCQNHFTPESYENLGMVSTGFSSRVFLKRGAIPTIRQCTSYRLVWVHLDPHKEPTESLKSTLRTTALAHCATASQECQQPASLLEARKVDFSCQTKTVKRTYGTQLTLRRPYVRSIAIQTDPSLFFPAPLKLVECGVNTDHQSAIFAPLPRDQSTPLKSHLKRPRLHVIEEEEDDQDDTLEGPSTSMVVEESGYNPDESLQLLPGSQDALDAPVIPAHKDKKYIVFQSKLMELLERCSVCQEPLKTRLRTKGTLLKVFYDCDYCLSKNTWETQPSIGVTPIGNAQLSAAVYLSGASFVKMEKVCKAMHLQIHKYNTFLRHAKAMIEPAIVHSWRTSQNEMLSTQMAEDGIKLGGDMRADSPGHSAKYGSYPMMNLDTGKIIDLQLVQSNEVGGSYHMELEGLKRSSNVIQNRGVSVKCVVTDRHPQVQKFLREDAQLTHFYDVWHVEKGLSKKLEVVSKKKEFGKLRSWIRSIRNHLYWTARSSTTAELRGAKWRAIINHCCNIHKHRGEKDFPKCLHPPRRTRDKKKYLTPGSALVHKLDKLLYNKRLMKDVEKLSPHHQTSAVESFHSVVIRFAPKSSAFKYIGMLCRLYLAGIHFNENAGRPPKIGKDGEPLHSFAFLKARKGECRAKAIKVDPTFGYVADLMDCIFDKVMLQPSPNPYIAALREIVVPEDLAAEYERPAREDVINAYVSRFNQGHEL